jgi:hypothetical protein
MCDRGPVREGVIENLIIDALARIPLMPALRLTGNDRQPFEAIEQRTQRHHPPVISNENNGHLTVRYDELPIISYYPAHESEDSNECCICTEKFQSNDSLNLLSCMHRFHVQCLSPWYETNKTCPVCRTLQVYTWDREMTTENE